MKLNYDQKIDYFNILYTIIFLFSMFTTVCFSDNYKDAIKKVYETRKEEKIIVKCKYYGYPNIILNSTPFPKVLIDLICELVDDKIIFKINIDGDDEEVTVQSEDAYVNCVKINIEFMISRYGIQFSSEKEINRLYHLCLSNNIIRSKYSHKCVNSTCARKVFEKIIKVYKKCKTINELYDCDLSNVKIIEICNRDLSNVKIVNKNLLLIVLNILCIFNKIQL